MLSPDSGPWADDLDGYSRELTLFLTSDPVLDQWRKRHHSSTEERMSDHVRLVSLLFDRGWSRYGWPTSAGGLGGNELHRAVLYDALPAADLPMPEPYQLVEILGPATIRYAPDLAAEHFPSYLSGREWWAQGFSEPEAGSDLASLRCRARRDGGTYVVSGQKIWTSHGATATKLFCLVRTGTAADRHKGLSVLLIDLDSPGVTTRPIALASGYNELAEVFLEDVVVPAERLIGDEGQGWTVAMHLLQYERALYAWQMSSTALHGLRSLGRIAATRLKDGGALPDGTRKRLGELYADVIALRARSAATVRRLAESAPVGPEASIDKIMLATVEINLHDFARQLLGPEFLFAPDPTSAQWRVDWWYSRSATILGGSAEVQRNILADHVLRLPKESGT